MTFFSIYSRGNTRAASWKEWKVAVEAAVKRKSKKKKVRERERICPERATWLARGPSREESRPLSAGCVARETNAYPKP